MTDLNRLTLWQESRTLSRITSSALVFLSLSTWFDEGILEAAVTWADERLSHADDSVEEEFLPRSRKRRIVMLVDELRSNDYVEPSSPVGFVLTPRGREEAAWTERELTEADRRELSFRVASAWTHLAARPGALRARRRLVEAARQVHREGTEGLVTAILTYTLRHALSGNADLLPVVFAQLFDVDIRNADVTLSSILARGVEVARERQWSSPERLLAPLARGFAERSPRVTQQISTASLRHADAVVSIRDLLEAGVHFGHQTRRWNPKMKRFIFGERNGIYIIDLNQTLQRIETAYTFVRDLTADGGNVLFIGTKKQTQDPIARYAQQCGMPYVNERWLGGMLTNFTTIAARVRKMQEYKRMRAAGDFDAMPKKEALIVSRELEKLERNLGGIRNMTKLPEAVFVIDTKKEHLAVTEANKLGIPVVAVVDTNCDPDLVQYVIPGNDESIRAGNLLCRVIAEAVEEGRFIASRRASRAVLAAEPAPLTAEQQAQRDAEQAEARRQFAEQAREREGRRTSAPPEPVVEGVTIRDEQEDEPPDDAASSARDEEWDFEERRRRERDFWAQRGQRPPKD